MTDKHLIKLLEQLILITLVSAGSVSKDNVNTILTQLPVSKAQLDDLALNICYNIEPFFPDQNLTECQEKFRNPRDRSLSLRPQLKVWCRFKEKIKFEIPQMDNWQIVLLIPQPTDDTAILNFRLLRPNTTFGEISMTQPYKQFMLLSTVLTRDSRPTLWRREEDIPPWEGVREHRQYDVNVQFMGYNDSGVVKGLFIWNQTGESDICFEFKNFCKYSGDRIIKLKPNSEPRLTIDNLVLNDECNAQLDGYYGTTELTYHTPVREENIIEDEKPEIPRDVSIEAVRDNVGWAVRVRWSRPRVTPARYNVTLRTHSVITAVLDANATEAVFRGVPGESGELYNVSIYAFKGLYTAHTSRRAIFPIVVNSWAGGLGAAWAGVGVVALALAFCCFRIRARIYTTRKQQQGSECKPLEESLRSWSSSMGGGSGRGSSDSGGSGGSGASGGSAGASGGSGSSGGDAWEVRAERVALHEQLGEGAFGVVHRATLAPNNREVAVKMLKDFPSAEEIRAFRLEMELMKSVGIHPHIVSLVGCCSGKRPLIIAEYCSRGDLLSFLRSSWDMMISKRNAKYYNNNIDTSEYRNDLFKYKSQMEQSKLVVNKLYDLQGLSDMELTSLDLLSFCRQIAMGMEFLASNRLVHRDLAARNVLVTHDRTLKIADFGLSRDVYEENQYKQKGNGKMPVKWMALESLTRRIYTSQSDVWSFGVVVWEVVTVGGAPYPGVAAGRLPRLLRAGYRMPRPNNCSAQLYELMLSCWRAEPRLRPTFSMLHARLDELLQSACADHYLSLELEDSPPPPAHHVYFRMLLRSKRVWSRGENYERPLKAPQTNLYTSSPVTHTRTPLT